MGVAFAFSVVARPALADDTPTRGRIDGDLALVVGGGGVVASRGPRLEGEIRIRYLDSAGAFVVYEDSAGFGSEPQRVLSAGLELRPLFLGRWLRGLETDRARIDLLVDSFGLEFGVVLAQPTGSEFGSSTGLQLGVGVEVPILANATGPWVGVHAGMRWSENAMAAGTVRDVDDRSAYVAVTLAWHQVVTSHLVELGDRSPE
jgi:hypothetical protein